MAGASEAPGAELSDQLQPDGNFRDDPSTDEDPELLRRRQEIDEQREANRVGPMHPAHENHAQWLAERGLGSGSGDDSIE